MTVSFAKLTSIADKPGDDSQTVASNHIMIHAGFLMCGGALVWGAITLIYGLYVVAIVPFGYILLSLINFIMVAYFGRRALARFIQTSANLMLPFIFQWLLGGFSASGGVMLWSLLALTVGALTTSDKRELCVIFLAFTILTIISASIDGMVFVPHILQSGTMSPIFFTINSTAVGFGLFLAVIYIMQSNRNLVNEVEVKNKQLKFSIISVQQERDFKEREALQAANDRFASTFENAPVGILTVDELGVITSVNRQIETDFGYADKTLEGQSISILLPGCLKEVHVDHLSKYMRNPEQRQMGASQDLYGVHSNGLQVPVEIALSPLEYKGRMSGVGDPHALAIVSDISARKQKDLDILEAKNQAEISEQAKGNFVSHMSHELRTPLNAVTSLSKVLVSDTIKTSPENQQIYLTAIHDSGQHLLQLIGDILDISKMDADARDLEDKPFTIAELINACRGTFDMVCQDKGISLTIDNQLEGEYPVLGDITALKQILFNLLSNAVKFTQKGAVSLTIAPHSDRQSNLCQGITFVVSDTGKGIAAEAMTTLFNRFTQEDSSITRSFGGSGLGLNISQSLAKLMGGNITCKSTFGKGSAFELVVFLEPQDIPRVNVKSEDDFSLPPIKVLLVDDIALNVMVGIAILEPKGHVISTASSGHQAVAMATNNDYDVILMDVHMPGMDGMEATREIRSIANVKRASVLIVALSADVDVVNQASFIAAGMDDSWSKSVLSEGFDEKLRGMLKLS